MLVASRGTFSLSVAVCNSRPLRDFVIGKLTSSDPRIALLPVPAATVDVFGCAAKCLRPGTSALFILGIEDSLSSAAPDSPLLASLNSSRDLWPKRFAMPVVLWMPEFAVALFSQHARDFWAWKSHQFEFVSELASVPAAMEDRYSGDLDWAANLSAEQKQFRIAELHQRIAEAGDPPPSELAGHVRTWLSELGCLALVTGDPRQSLLHFGKATCLAERTGDRSAQGAGLGNLGLAYADLGETRRAIEYYEQHLKIAREIGARSGEGSALGNLGAAYCVLGETRRAIEFQEQALAVEREIGDRRGEGQVLGNLGSAYYVLGEPRRAIEYYEQALAIAREIGDRCGEGQNLGNLGNAYNVLGETRRAIDYYEQALAIAREIGGRRGEGRDLWGMAFALKQLGLMDEAIPNAEAALAIYEAIEDPHAEMVRRALQEWRKAKGGGK
jgi:tetratricopeptide (TPR) repeat protein